MGKLITIVAVILILAVVFVFISKSLTGNSIKENTKEFTIKAYRFGYSPDLIQVDRGDKVIINIDNTDTLHGIRIPELGLKNNEKLEFTADKSGEFVWYCANMCGSEHMAMKGKLVVK